MRNVVVRVAPQDILTSVLNRAREQVVPGRTGRNGWRMTGSAFASLRGAERCVQVGSAGYIPLGRGRSGGGSRPAAFTAERLADDGKRLCDLIAARDVVI